MNKETFCSLPFSAIFLGSDGGVRPCCSLRGNLGNINQEPLVNILNGNTAKRLRENIINGQWDPMCSQCEDLESKGARTERTHTVPLFDKFADVTPSTFRLEKLDLRWSNVCNLTCNYCYEYFSSQWAAIKRIKINANKAHAEDSVFKFIQDNKDNINNIQLLGGEPLLQKPNNQLLDLVPNSNYYILTNLSTELEGNILAEKLIASKKVAWGVSFETIEKRFEYVRHGAQWSRLLHNFKLLAENKRMVDAHPLYCIYSAFNLVEYYEFITNEGNFNHIYWQLLQNIPGLDVFRLPNPMKFKALDEIEKVFERYGDKWDMTLLTNIYTKLKSTLQTPSINSTEAYSYFDELEQYLPNKKQDFINLWPSVYNDIVTYKESNYPT
jgi:MoaA/NifB/PqqE/SkfB family radical SAM enzyme